MPLNESVPHCENCGQLNVANCHFCSTHLCPTCAEPLHLENGEIARACSLCAENCRSCVTCERTFSPEITYYWGHRGECSACSEVRERGNRPSSPEFFANYSSDWRGVLNHSTRPARWPVVYADSEAIGGKKPKNVRLFGLEIEVNYRCPHDEIWEVCRQYMPGAFIMKHDGSLTTGSEIVIAPHSLEAIRTKLNLRGLLRSLVSKGARAYESGQCGLHIHVPWPGEAIAEKITAFFVANRNEIRIFSKRSEESLSRWANVKTPDWSRFTQRPYSANLRYVERGNKYISVNPHGETLEFRCFRGTLNYKRVRASIEFVDAICSHAEETSLATLGSRKSWAAFMGYLQGRARYHGLFRYLEGVSFTAGVPRTEVEPGAGSEIGKLAFKPVDIDSYVPTLIPEVVPSPIGEMAAPMTGSRFRDAIVDAALIAFLDGRASTIPVMPHGGYASSRSDVFCIRGLRVREHVNSITGLVDRVTIDRGDPSVGLGSLYLQLSETFTRDRLEDRLRERAQRIERADGMRWSSTATNGSNYRYIHPDAAIASPQQAASLAEAAEQRARAAENLFSPGFVDRDDLIEEIEESLF